MLVFEEYARLGLVMHAVLGAAVVASSTHLVLWTRRFPAGEYQRAQASRRFAAITLGLFVLTFVIGNLIYPVYKVRVRAEYLDDGTAVARDSKARAEASFQAQSRYADLNDQVAPDRGARLRHDEAARRATKMSRWFDVKEHWVALGVMSSLGCFLLLRLWRPEEHPPAVPTAAFWLAVCTASIAWFGAIIGLLVSSHRAIGGL